jgi:hypothetical protein
MSTVTKLQLSFDGGAWSDELHAKVLRFALEHGAHVGKPWTLDYGKSTFRQTRIEIAPGETAMEMRRRIVAEKQASVAALLAAGHTYRELLLMKRDQEKREWSGEKTRALRCAVAQHPGSLQYKIDMFDRYTRKQASLKQLGEECGVTRERARQMTLVAERWLKHPKNKKHSVRVALIRDLPERFKYWH